jgi:hypothetical protein
LQALGTFLVAFSELEETLHFAIANVFAEAETRAYALTAGLSFRTLVEKFGAVYQDTPRRNSAPGDVREFCRHLGTLNDERNQLVHAIWLTFNGGMVHRGTRRASPRYGLHSESEPITAEAILALASKCDDASTKLYEYMSSTDSPPPHASIT